MRSVENLVAAALRQSRRSSASTSGVRSMSSASSAQMNPVTLGEGEHGCSYGQGLDHHQSERLRPADRVEQRLGAGQQLDLLATSDLTEVDDVVAEHRPHPLLEVALLERLPHLGGDVQRPSRGASDADRPVHPLVGVHPPEERQVAAGAGADREAVHVDAVVDDRRHRDLGRHVALMLGDGDDGDVLTDGAVELGELGREHTVCRRDDRRRDVVGDRPQRAEQRVVVDHVTSRQLGVRRLHVSELVHQQAGRAEGLRVDPVSLDGAGRIPGGEQAHLVTLGLQPAGEMVDHELGPAVVRRGHGYPRWCDQPDAETMRSHRLHCTPVGGWSPEPNVPRSVGASAARADARSAGHRECAVPLRGRDLHRQR
jgi:hypothetical protein